MTPFADSQAGLRCLSRKGNTRDAQELNNVEEHESFIVVRVEALTLDRRHCSRVASSLRESNPL